MFKPKPISPILVACAIIENEGKILVAQRGPAMSMGGYWEFPGGKQESGETAEQCLIREIKEELNLVISVLQRLPDFAYQYADRSIVLMPFICCVTSGELTLAEHSQIQWLELPAIANLPLAPADVPVLQYLLGMGK